MFKKQQRNKCVKNRVKGRKSEETRSERSQEWCKGAQWPDHTSSFVSVYLLGEPD